MTLESIIVLVIVFVLLALAVLFICQNGGSAPKDPPQDNVPKT